MELQITNSLSWMRFLLHDLTDPKFVLTNKILNEMWPRIKKMPTNCHDFSDYLRRIGRTPNILPSHYVGHTCSFLKSLSSLSQWNFDPLQVDNFQKLIFDQHFNKKFERKLHMTIMLGTKNMSILFDERVNKIKGPYDKNENPFFFC